MCNYIQPEGTIRYSVGIEFKNGMVGSMSDVDHTPLTIRALLTHYRKNESFLKGLKLRVLKYRKDKTSWFCDQNNDPKAKRYLII